MEKIICKKCGGTGKVQSKFIGLAEPITPDIMIAGGSMGLGLPGAVGLALAKKIKKEEGKVYVLMSDGEQACGTTWESALIAAHHKLDNLTVIVDVNGFQAMGKTKDVLNLDSLFEKWESFGWWGFRVNGHNHEGLYEPLTRRLGGIGQPYFLLAETIKGKGVSFMENNNLYHYKAPNEEEYLKALAELHG